MQKILHKLIRYRRGEINVVADLNAAIATGGSGSSYASVESNSRIVQRSGRTTVVTNSEQSSEKEVHDGNDEG